MKFISYNNKHGLENVFNFAGKLIIYALMPKCLNKNCSDKFNCYYKPDTS